MPDNELRRDRELLTRRNSKLYKEVIETFQKIKTGFEQQGDRSMRIANYWDIYNCIPNRNRGYNGNAELYLPLVNNAIEALTTRDLNQLFPSSGRYIDVSSTDGGDAYAIVALLEDYVRKSFLRTQLIAALLRNGQVEGQYNLYVDWNMTSRWVVSRETVPVTVRLPGDLRAIGEMDDEPIERIVSREVFDQHPYLEVIHDTDVLVRPVTAMSIEDALRQGGDVTIIRRYTKETIKEMKARGEIMDDPANQLLEISRKQSEDPHSTETDLLDAAGVHGKGDKFNVYETWKCLDIEGQGRRLCKTLYGGYDLILTGKRNNFWNDRCPLISSPVIKQTGIFKGTSPISKGVDTIQYQANDIANQGADSATFRMLPIIMTDPAKNPRTATMLLNLAAIWEVDPNSTKFAEFPPLWQDAAQLVQGYTSLVFQAMGVNPSMLPQSTGRPGSRRNQAEVAMEQQVDILGASIRCSVVQDDVLNPMLQRWVEYDHQFRDDEMTVQAYGELGHAAKMEKVLPIQAGNRYFFSWSGVEQARNAATQQQQIALANVATTPQMSQALQQAGYQFNPAPFLISAVGNISGWRVGRQIMRDIKTGTAMDPETENQMLAEGFDVPVHPIDEDPMHIPSHVQSMQMWPPDSLQYAMHKDHITKHTIQQGLKANAAAQQGAGMPPQQGGQPQQQQGQQPQRPGGGAPGGAPPQAGGMTPGPRLLRGPPGTIPPDQMPRAGAVMMPRK